MRGTSLDREDHLLELEEGASLHAYLRRLMRGATPRELQSGEEGMLWQEAQHFRPQMDRDRAVYAFLRHELLTSSVLWEVACFTTDRDTLRSILRHENISPAARALAIKKACVTPGEPQNLIHHELAKPHEVLLLARLGHLWGAWDNTGFVQKALAALALPLERQEIFLALLQEEERTSTQLLHGRIEVLLAAAATA